MNYSQGAKSLTQKTLVKSASATIKTQSLQTKSPFEKKKLQVVKPQPIQPVEIKNVKKNPVEAKKNFKQMIEQFKQEVSPPKPFALKLNKMRPTTFKNKKAPAAVTKIPSPLANPVPTTQMPKRPSSPAKSVHFSESGSTQAGGATKRPISTDRPSSKQKKRPRSGSSLSAKERRQHQKRRKNIGISDQSYMVRENLNDEDSPKIKNLKLSDKSKRKSSKSLKRSESVKKPRFTFDQQIDMLPEFPGPTFLATTALRKDYSQQVKSILDANIMLFDSNCFFKPRINKVSQELSRPKGQVFQNLYLRNKQQQDELAQKQLARQFELYNNDLAECTFHPAVNESVKTLRTSHSEIYERNQMWQQAVSKKIRKLQKSKEKEINHEMKPKPQLKQSSSSYRIQLQESQKIEKVGGLDVVVRGTNTHMARILQANQQKIQKQEAFLLPSQKLALQKFRANNQLGFMMTEQFQRPLNFELTPKQNEIKNSKVLLTQRKEERPKSQERTQIQFPRFSQDDNMAATALFEFEQQFDEVELRQRLRSSIMSIDLNSNEVT